MAVREEGGVQTRFMGCMGSNFGRILGGAGKGGGGGDSSHA